MKTTIRCLFFSCLIVLLLGIGSHVLAQKAVPLSEQEKAFINQGVTSAPSSASVPAKKLPAAKVIKKKPASAAATSATTKPSTSIRKTTALPATSAYTPPAVKSVTKKPASATATGVTSTPSTGIRKTATLPVKPSYTPPAASTQQVSSKPSVQQSEAISITPRSGYVAPSFTPPPATGGIGVSGQGPGVKSAGTYVAPAYTPPSLSLPSKTVGVGTAVEGQGIQTPSGSYVTPMYDPPRSGPLGSGAPAGQPGPATTVPRSGSVPLFPVSAGTGAGGQEQGVKTTSSFLMPSSAGGKEATPGTDAGASLSGSTPSPVVDNAERLQRLREKYGKEDTAAGGALSKDERSKAAGGKKEAADGGATSAQSEGKGVTVPGAKVAGDKAGKTAAAMALEAAAAASAAPGVVGARTKEESSGQGQLSDTAGTGQQGETAADREKEVRERFNIPEDVPIKSTAEALGFAKQFEALGGKLTRETWREQKEKGSDEVVGKQVRDTFGIPDDVPVGSIKDAIDFARDVQMLTGDNKPEAWRLRQEKGSKAATKEIICKTYELPDCTVIASPEDLLKGIAEGERLGVPLQELPDFIKDWGRQRSGGITLDELLKKWFPGAKPGIDRGGLPGDGLPDGPGDGPGGVPGSGSGQPGNLVDVMRTGFGIGAAAGGGSGGTGTPGAPGGGSGGTGIPGVPGVGSGGSGGQGGALGSGRAAGLLDPLATGTGIGAPGQSGGGQGQSSSGTSTTPGTGISGSGSGSGGTGSGSGGGTGNTVGTGAAGSSSNNASGPSTGGYVTYTNDRGFDLTATDDQGTVTIHFTPNGDGTYTGTTQNGQVLTTSGKPPEGDVTGGTDQGQDYISWDQGSDSGSGTSTGQTSGSGSTGSDTSSSGSTTSTGGTQGTGEEEGQSGMYNPDDDSLYRRSMTAEERAKAVEESQKLKPVDGGRGGEGGGQRRTGLKVSDVNTMEIMKSKTDPYITPNPEADQGGHSGPIPVGDERGNIEQPVRDGGSAAQGLGRMGGATRPGGGQSGTGGGFDPRVAGEQPE